MGIRTWKIESDNEAVARHVECYWFIGKPANQTQIPFPRLYPDATAHLLLCPDDQRWSYDRADVSFTGSGHHLLLPHKSSYLMNHAARVSMLGIKWRLAAPGVLSSTRTSQLTDHVLATESSRLPAAVPCVKVLLTQSAENCRQQLDAWLAPHLASLPLSRAVRRLRRCQRMLIEGLPVALLADRLACSRRTLERDAIRLTGFTLKQLQAIERLDAMLLHLHARRGEVIDWSDLALQFGFSDQPHMIRQLRQDMGQTPGAYLRQRDLTIDAYGDFQQNHGADPPFH